MIGTGLVAFTYDSTAQRIADNQRKALLKSLNELIPSERYDNDIFTDTLYVVSSELLGTDTPVPVYRARKHGWPVAAVLAVVAPDGYNGPAFRSQIETYRYFKKNKKIEQVPAEYHSIHSCNDQTKKCIVITFCCILPYVRDWIEQGNKPNQVNDA